MTPRQPFLDKIYLKYRKVDDFWMCIDFWVIHEALNYLKLCVYLSNLSSTFPSLLFLFPSTFFSSHPNACDRTSKLGFSRLSGPQRFWGLSVVPVTGHNLRPFHSAPVGCCLSETAPAMSAGTHTKNCHLQKDFSAKNHIISNIIYHFLNIYAFNIS